MFLLIIFYLAAGDRGLMFMTPQLCRELPIVTLQLPHLHLCHPFNCPRLQLSIVTLFQLSHLLLCHRRSIFMLKSSLSLFCQLVVVLLKYWKSEYHFNWIVVSVSSAATIKSKTKSWVKNNQQKLQNLPPPSDHSNKADSLGFMRLLEFLSSIHLTFPLDTHLWQFVTICNNLSGDIFVMRLHTHHSLVTTYQCPIIFQLFICRHIFCTGRTHTHQLEPKLLLDKYGCPLKYAYMPICPNGIFGQ